MFEKLITDLKKSLPGSLRKKSGAEDSEDTESETENDSESSEDASVNAEKEKKDKQKSMIIKVIIILGIGYVVVDEFILKKSNDPSVEEMLAKAPKKKKSKVVKPATAAPAVDATVAAAAALGNTDPSTATAQVPDAPAPTDSSATSTPPIENVNVLDKADTATLDHPAEKENAQAKLPAEEPVVKETRVAEPSVDQKIDQLVENVDATTNPNPVEEVKIPSQPTKTAETTQSTKNDISEIHQVPKETASGDATEAATTTSAPSMASKIVEGITETAPPAYDQVGRGLVYNCKDKYWACLDKPAYVTCNKNMKWNKSKGNSAECVVSSIYASEEDCAKVQKYNVSMSVSTTFCKQ